MPSISNVYQSLSTAPGSVSYLTVELPDDLVALDPVANGVVVTVTQDDPPNATWTGPVICVQPSHVADHTIWWVKLTSQAAVRVAVAAVGAVKSVQPFTVTIESGPAGRRVVCMPFPCDLYVS